MRILVTGGAGFIGSHIVDALHVDGHETIVLDRMTGGDLTSVDDWVASLDGVDAVCHQGARVGLGVRPSDVTGYVMDNDVGTAAGLWAMDAVGFRGRLVLASSMVVYGEGRYVCNDHGDVRPDRRRPEDLDGGVFDPRCPGCDQPLEPTLVTEDAPPDPRNVYAATKLHQEHLCTTVGAELGIPVTALRYHNVYGPRMPRDTPYSGVAAIFRTALAGGRAPQVFEDGRQRRDFVHVHDVARANVLALTSPEPVPGALNICSGEPRTVGDLAGVLAEALAGPAPEVTGRWRLGDVRHVTASPERAARLLGFRATVPFSEGIAQLAHEPDVGR
jgi:dTDP-L-rhamnose 4-epimerase